MLTTRMSVWLWRIEWVKTLLKKGKERVMAVVTKIEARDRLLGGREGGGRREAWGEDIIIIRVWVVNI